MTTNRFRAVALALRGIVTDTYTMLDAADAVVALDAGFLADNKPPTISLNIPHDILVFAALGNEHIVSEAVNNEGRIRPIKALRALAPAFNGREPARGAVISLKAAKDAIDDPRFQSRIETLKAEKRDRDIAELRERLTMDPWDPRHTDEPPF